MFHPLSIFVGLRYARARSHRFFVSFITWVSLAGVAVGVAALIVILSVMNGFEGELRSRLLSLSAAVRVESADGAVVDWLPLQARLQSVPGVSGVTRYAELQVLAVRQPEMQPLALRAVESVPVADLARLVDEGRIEALTETAESLILGRVAAEQLGIGVGDTLTLLVPTLSEASVPEARLREFQVVGLFDAGIPDHDAGLAFTRLATLSALGAERSGATGLALQTPEPLAAPAVAAAVERLLRESGMQGLRVHDWTRDHASYFRAIRIEKTMMALILMMVVGVAAFNIVAMLVMVVTDKRTDIAILRTQGASPRRVAAVFVTQGMMVGSVGVALGVILGLLVASHVGALLAVLERLSGTHLFDADAFYITRVPSELHALDVLLITGCALLVTVAATIYPALRAAATSPAEALRYE